MRYYQAQDTFVADLEDGTAITVAKGQPFPEDHPLVKRDQEARKKDGGTPLFALLDPGSGEEAVAKSSPRRAGRSGG